MSILDALDDEIRSRVPLAAGYRDAQVIDEAEHVGTIIATAADALQARGEVNARVFAAIASGVSLLARRDQGVTFNGRHYCRPSQRCDNHPGRGEWLHEPPKRPVGAVYTPQWMADQVTVETLNAVCAQPGPLETWDAEKWQCIPAHELLEVRVADIACGSGVFLRSATEYLASVLAEAVGSAIHVNPDDLVRWTRLQVMKRCVFGVDIDPWAVELARLSLALLNPLDHVDEHIAHHVITGDSLTAVRHDGDDERRYSTESIDFRAVFPEIGGRGFDAVIGNPPFLGGQKITGALGKDYRRWLVERVAGGVTGSADLSAYFLLTAWHLLSRTGQLGLITTNTILQGATKRVGLGQIENEGGTLRLRVKSAPWPTDRAALEYSVLWISRMPVRSGPRALDRLESSSQRGAA